MLDAYRLYRFPANSRAEVATFEEQMDKTHREAHEVLSAWISEEGEERLIEELWDTIHAAEGALRKFKPQQVRDGYFMVMAKNNERGDYDTEAVRCDDWGLV